jgi:hypothetical protein
MAVQQQQHWFRASAAGSALNSREAGWVPEIFSIRRKTQNSP